LFISIQRNRKMANIYGLPSPLLPLYVTPGLSRDEEKQILLKVNGINESIINHRMNESINP
jgi:hypothetical protein